MTDNLGDERREVVEEIRTQHGRQEDARKQDRAYQASGTEGVEITPEYRRFLQALLDGKGLPSLDDVPPLDPAVELMVAELLVLHLPEWRTPTGRKIAEPTTIKTPQAPRVAAWLIARGWRHHPELETVRWVPTPGTSGGPYDDGLHVHPDEHGQWPDPDPEAFYDIDDIDCAQQVSGRWAATHPRGITFEADTKSEAYAGLVERLRKRIEEAKHGMEG